MSKPELQPASPGSGASTATYVQIFAGIAFLLAAVFRLSDITNSSADWKDYAATIGWTLAGLLSLTAAALRYRRSH